MAKSWNRIEIWLGLGVLAIGLIAMAVQGLFIFMSATAVPLHPNTEGVPSAVRSTPSAKWTDAVEQARQMVRANLTEQNLPGLSVAIGVKGDLVWAEGFGFADIETRKPVTPETRFRIGTASTPLTSAAAGLLVQEGRLKLDDEIQTYVKESPKKEWPVTLRQLMGHTAGLRNDGGDEGPLFAEHCEKPAEALKFFSEGSLRFEPGTAYRFSNYDWIVVSAAVEAAAGEPFLSFIQKKIFDAAGMVQTGPDPTPEPSSLGASEALGRATSYFPKFAANNRYGPDLMRPLDYSCYAGSSVFVSTPSDLVRFAQAIHAGRLLKPEIVELFQTSVRLTSGEETGYGLGWDLETAELGGKPTRWTGHEGTLLGGMAASLIVFPEQSIVVSVVSNTSYAGTEALGLKLAQAFVK